MNTILSLQNITHSYHSMEGEILALSNLSLDVKEGEFVSMVGASGCGKSTLLSIIAGLIKPEEGTVSFHKKQIGYMLQKDHLLEWRSILKNVTLGLELQHKLNEAEKKRAKKMLAQYGLDAFANAKPSQLSGGMRQRAALIRTLILNPDLLLLDEPFSALDYHTRLTVGDDIWHIIRNQHKTAILVTHDLAEAISFGDKVLILSSRPGTLKSVLSLSFPPEKNTPLLRRSTTEFNEYFQFLWKELNENESFI